MLHAIVQVNGYQPPLITTGISFLRVIIGSAALSAIPDRIIINHIPVTTAMNIHSPVLPSSTLRKEYPIIRTALNVTAAEVKTVKEKEATKMMISLPQAGSYLTEISC